MLFARANYRWFVSKKHTSGLISMPWVDKKRAHCTSLWWRMSHEWWDSKRLYLWIQRSYFRLLIKHTVALIINTVICLVRIVSPFQTCLGWRFWLYFIPWMISYWKCAIKFIYIFFLSYQLFQSVVNSRHYFLLTVRFGTVSKYSPKMLSCVLVLFCYFQDLIIRINMQNKSML